MGIWTWFENGTPLWVWIVWVIVVGAIAVSCIQEWLENRNTRGK